MSDEELTEKSDSHRAPRLYVSNDRLEVLVEWSPLSDDPDAIAAMLAPLWSGLRIDLPYNEYEVAARLRGAKGTLEASPLVLASGQSARPPIHGDISWGGPYFESGFEIDATTGAVNFRRKTARTTVAEGECLAVVHPPVEGTPGRDVFGKTIQPVAARRAALERGDNVAVNADGTTFTAMREGHIRLLGTRLYVDETYVLSGVDLKSGDIDHPGALEVRGDVEPGSHIRTRGNIYIRGIVQEATIECGGDLHVGGGIVGGDGHSIQVAGNLHARYLAHVTLQVEGDVTVEREIDQCDLKARGFVSVPEGRIAGGNVDALKGVYVNEAGSHGSVQTRFIIGVDVRIHELIRNKIEATDSLSQTIAKIHEGLTPLLPYEARLDAGRRAMLKQLRDKLAALELQHADAEVELQNLRQEAHARSNGRIDVRSMLNSEVYVNISGCPFHVVDPIRGPVHLAVVEGEVVMIAGVGNPP